MILPFSPVPFTYFKSIPFSCAIFLANGEAKIRPSFTTCTVVVTFAVGAIVAGADAATGAVAGAAAGVADVPLPAFIPFTIASISIPA